MAPDFGPMIYWDDLGGGKNMAYFTQFIAYGAFAALRLVAGIVLASLMMAWSASLAQETSADPGVYVVFDGSNSMWGPVDPAGDDNAERKIEIAKRVFSDYLENDFAGRDLALRIYGHNRAGDCSDTELVADFAPAEANADVMRDAVNAVSPRGKTPITRSLRAARDDFAARSGDILLISDGIETCDTDPCALMQEWREAGVSLRVHVVGFGLRDEERYALACVAETSGGQYFDAQNAEGLAEALSEAREAVLSEPPQDGAPDPQDQTQGYELRILASDDQGRTLPVRGTLIKADREERDEPQNVGNHQRNIVEPGDYTLSVGALLRTGELYDQVNQTVRITEPGVTTVEVIAPRPPSVSATFLENGEETRGALIYAYQNGEEVFRFRWFDEVFAAPGEYEFQSTPNADNALSLTANLLPGEHTDLVFEMTQTVRAYVTLVLPNGEKIQRGAELWRDGEKAYSVHGGNGVLAQPGIYELRSEDQNAPLTPVDIEIREDGETVEVPLAAGFVVISYGPPEAYYIGNPDRAFLESLDRGGSSYAQPDAEIAVAPGAYKINPHTSAGFFDPVEISVREGETVEAVITPKPVGSIVVTYAPSDAYESEPDRAFVYPLEGQEVRKSFMRPGVPLKFLPGRYRVEPTKSIDGIEAQEVTVTAGDTQEVVLGR